jgi:eukaryotic-like serine/threonine-protein kinase
VSLPPGTRVGKYVIQRKLAEGGMAEIFLASSFGPEGFEKQVIIKRIRPNFADDASFVEMFVSEARLVSKLNHANIVQVFDFDRHEDTFYIAMEYVRGKSLAQAHQRSRELGIPLAPALAAQIVVEVARGLGFAHRLTEHGQPLGIVHRDVTPQNVLLSYEGAVKLTDFGIAKAGTRASTVGMLKGKFAYMSPEQSRGQPVDARTDIFALGITLWELLSGSRLFDADSDVAVLHAVQERTVVSPEKLNAAVGTGLSAIVLKCLEREKDARFQTAQELERALSRYLATTAEETDVGAWMHSVFPIEAGRTESTEFREDRAPIRLEGGVTGTGLEGTAARVSSANVPPAGLLAGGTRGQGWQREAAAGWDGPTARTPIVSRANPDEPSTRSSVAPVATGHRALFLGFGAGLTVVALAFALAYFLGPRSRPEPAVAPATPAPLRTPAPVVPVQPPPVAVVPTPPAVVEAPKPPVQEAVPPPEAKPVQKPEVRKKAPAHKAHATAKQTPAPPVAPVATPKEAPAPKQAPTGAPGTLVLIVNPPGEVLIDGKLQRKQEGRAEYPLPPGTHQVEVRGPSNWRKEIAVEAGQKTWEWAYR